MPSSVGSSVPSILCLFCDRGAQRNVLGSLSPTQQAAINTALNEVMLRIREGGEISLPPWESRPQKPQMLTLHGWSSQGAWPRAGLAT